MQSTPTAGLPAQRLRVVLPLLAVTLGLLAGCGPKQEELQAWVQQQAREARPQVQALRPPGQFSPEPYSVAQATDPFSVQKLSVAIRQEARLPNSLLSAEMDRRREPLESFPLDAMSMVGSVTRDDQPFGLLRVDTLLYQVKVGDYLGQNFGRITRITETEIVLREIVQDGAGEWIERPTTLQLQEAAR
jgi:type IV pilus assembly protein PilP